MTMNLGRMERVPLREVWEKEAIHFTPWLAREENLSLLGEAIGIELELEAQEKEVGPFRADILCKNQVTGEWVLIENQLERSDHTHLGQLLTYAAGLNTVTIVWVAAKFTEEHRAALDWLNEVTDERINFFGLEIELWRIGDSAIAPKFNLASKPNGWTKSIASATHRGDLTETRALQLDYWTAFKAYLDKSGTILKGANPAPQHYMSFATGKSGVLLTAYANMRDNRISVALIVLGKYRGWFEFLESRKVEIEKELGQLDWHNEPDRREPQIFLRWNGVDPSERKEWPKQHKWLLEKLEAFHKVFAPIVKNFGEKAEVVG
jgi:hypothetical protein